MYSLSLLFLARLSRRTRSRRWYRKSLHLLRVLSWGRLALVALQTGANSSAVGFQMVVAVIGTHQVLCRNPRRGHDTLRMVHTMLAPMMQLLLRLMLWVLLTEDHILLAQAISKMQT